MNVSRFFLSLALALIISLGVIASWLVYSATERVARSNHELVKLGIGDLGAIARFRAELAEYERLAYELYAVIDASSFQPVLIEQQRTVESRMDDLEALGMSPTNTARLLGYWHEIVGVVGMLIENIDAVEQRQTDWDAARSQLKAISRYRRQIDPQLDMLVDEVAHQTRLAEQLNREELTFMSVLIIAYVIVILGISFAVAWLLKRLFAATESNRALARFPARNPMPVITVDESGNVLYANGSAKDFVASELGENASVDALVSTRVRENLLASLTDGERGSMHEEVGSRSLAYNWCWLEDHRIFHVYLRDVTREKLAESRLKRMAYEDSVTGLMNRHAMIGKLDELLVQNQPVCLSLLSIERFYLVPSSLGIDIADSLLSEFSRQLKKCADACIGQSIFIARVEGAVFAVGWVHDCVDKEVFGKLNQFLRSLPNEIRCEGASFHADYCLGARIRSPGQKLTSKSMFSDAGTALLVAEGRKGARCVLHDTDIREHEQSVLLVEDKLRSAIESDEPGLKLFLQPKIDLQTEKILGAEALIRWMDPELGEMRPDRFIPIAEQSGLIVNLGHWVCTRALAILAQWHLDPQLSSLHLAINAAPQELQAEGYAQYLLQGLESAGISPGLLEIEVTERALADTADIHRVDALGLLRAAGVEVAIDDFGTGYSSLAYLTSLPISQIKIDRRFVENLPTGGVDLARVIVNLSTELGHVSVAEGVETEAQADYLRKIGCDCAQGYYFGRPMELEDFELMVRASEVTA